MIFIRLEVTSSSSKNEDIFIVRLIVILKNVFSTFNT